MRFIYSVTVCLLLASNSAIAQTTPRKLELATELMKLLRVEESFAAYLRECSKPEGSPFDPKTEFQSNPGSFGGISPQSAYWPEVEGIYARFQATSCAYAAPDKFSRFYIQHFAEHVSEQDLLASIAFQSSPTGRRLQDAVVGANAGFQVFATQLMYEAYESARAQFQTEVRALQRKYKAKPQ